MMNGGSLSYYVIKVNSSNERLALFVPYSKQEHEMKPIKKVAPAAKQVLNGGKYMARN
jgi:hypothetical protein